MLNSVHIWEDSDEVFDRDDDEYVGAGVEFSGTDALNTDRFFIPYPRSLVLLEYITRLCLEDWPNTRPQENLVAPKDSVRQMPVMTVRAIDIIADKDHVLVEFVGSDGTVVRYFHVPNPRGRILLEHAARVCVEERVDMAMAAKSDIVLKAVEQPVKEAAE
jgi:hypothetical protein